MNSVSVHFDLLPSDALDTGTAEEMATYGRFSLRACGQLLTEGRSFHASNGRVDGPMVAACHVAEWLAWNWWRLRWEPFRPSRFSPDWWRAHSLRAIGEGYAWPNVTLFSDGMRSTILSEASTDPDAKPIYYFGATPVVVPATMLEQAIDRFIDEVIDRMERHDLTGTNLESLRADLRDERADPQVAMRRKLEALLGWEPDQGSETVLHQLMEDARVLGAEAMGEVAADHQDDSPDRVVLADDLRRIAGTCGVTTRQSDIVRLTDATLPERAQNPGWVVGTHAARALRRQIALPAEDQVSNHRLTELLALPQQAMKKDMDSPLAFSLHSDADGTKVVFRSRRETGRRFELARLLGDHVTQAVGESLHPATRARTYRQQIQRAFAAEFLAPLDAVEAMLGNDDSQENLEDAAEHFKVSELTIRTLLVNNGRRPRSWLNSGDYDFAA